MPCVSDYMEPTEREKESVRVKEFLREIDGKPFDHDRPHGDMYGDIKNLNSDTARLCSFLKTNSERNVKNFSLELQIWWRDHKKADEKREQQEKQSKEKLKLIQSAKSKLTKKEREALGL